MLLTEIEKKIEELKAQADAVKAQEKAQAIDAARAMISSYGITARDLGLDKAPKGKAGPKPGSKIPPKYRDPLSGATWSGRVRPPRGSTVLIGPSTLSNLTGGL
jgi:DNA-binding protein H-NS